MKEVLRPMIGTHVAVEHQSPACVSGGLLVHVGEDFLSLKTFDDVQHIPFSHIQAVVTNHTEIPKASAGATDVSGHFHDLLRSMQKQMVRVYMSTSKRVGLLSDVSDENISLVLDMSHMVHYRIRHITGVAQVTPIVDSLAVADGAEDLNRVPDIQLETAYDDRHVQDDWKQEVLVNELSGDEWIDSEIETSIKLPTLFLDPATGATLKVKPECKASGSSSHKNSKKLPRYMTPSHGHTRSKSSSKHGTRTVIYTPA